MAMSDVHQDLESIHNILLGQRKVAQDNYDFCKGRGFGASAIWLARVECINDLLLEFEAAGVVWPTNVVELNTVTSPCACGGDLHPACGPNC